MKRARDIMATEVVTVAPDTSVRELTRLLADEAISGVPVVDSSGDVMGVVSSTDVVRFAATTSDVSWLDAYPEETYESDVQSRGAYFLPEDWPDFVRRVPATEVPNAFSDFTVSELMTPVSFSIEPHASVKDVADFLVRGRIHRALVIDGGRLVGIVTAMDVLRAVAEGA